MSNQKQRVEMKQLDDGLIELRYFDEPKSDRYLGWNIPIRDTIDLAQWWENEGIQIRTRQLPVVDRKFGCVLISMFTESTVEVRAIDQYGRTMFRGYSLPRKVVEHLVVWLQNGQHFQKSSIGMEAKTCT